MSDRLSGRNLLHNREPKPIDPKPGPVPAYIFWQYVLLWSSLTDNFKCPPKPFLTIRFNVERRISLAHFQSWKYNSLLSHTFRQVTLVMLLSFAKFLVDAVFTVVWMWFLHETWAPCSPWFFKHNGHRGENSFDPDCVAQRARLASENRRLCVRCVLNIVLSWNMDAVFTVVLNTADTEAKIHLILIA